MFNNNIKMLNKVKNTFSIKDLENLSGVKAHTIRIWEKRYNAFEPMRTETNIRLYDLESLQKLLNISLLHNYGYKISKITTKSDEEISRQVNSIISGKNANNHAINTFKIAMMNFDQALFVNTYNWLISEKSFRNVFAEVFIPLLEELGLLWQTNTISPSHEHFITQLIKQKIILNIDAIQVNVPTKFDKVFILSLPTDEIHDMGLLYLNYELILAGYKVINLGENLPFQFLKEIKNNFENIVFVSYFTVYPQTGELIDYVRKMEEELIDETTEIWLLGRKTALLNKQELSERTLVFNSILDLLATFV